MANYYSHGARLQIVVMYKECLHNHAAHANGYVLDGCGLFEASGPNGTHKAMFCAACRCHRNFHRRVEVDLPRGHETQTDGRTDIPPLSPQPQVRQQPPLRSHAPASAPGPEFTDSPPQPQVRRETSTSHAPASAPSPVRRQDMNRPQGVQYCNTLLRIPLLRLSNVSPVDQGFFGRQAVEAGSGGHRKRLTGGQSERLRAIAERNNWKMFREYSKDEVAQICSEIGIQRECLKAWITYHRHERSARQAASD